MQLMFYHYPEFQCDMVPFGTGPFLHFMLRIRYRTLASFTSTPISYFQAAVSYLQKPMPRRHVHGNGKTGIYRPTTLLVKLYINLVVTVSNYLLLKKTSIFK